MGLMTSEYKIPVRKSEVRDNLGESRQRWEDNIKTDLKKKMGWEIEDW
jgi:hypothetical protein